MLVNTNVESAIMRLAELNNMVRFIDTHAYDITDADNAIGMLHIIAGQLDSRTKALIESFYGERKDV